MEPIVKAGLDYKTETEAGESMPEEGTTADGVIDSVNDNTAEEIADAYATMGQVSLTLNKSSKILKQF